jgi:DNA sulfur modification protein DndD
MGCHQPCPYIHAICSCQWARLCVPVDGREKACHTPSKDFSVTLYDRQSQPLPKAQLSAGEKQIYAISMLWALGKVSGRPLPIIVDTPLARLDREHRKLLVRHYFPVASHQVILLSTDTEVDQSSFVELRRHITREYNLEFDPAECDTTIAPGYFWKDTDETH